MPSAVPATEPLATAPAGVVHCSNCEAACCRLLVVLLPGDDIAPHLTAVSDAGLDVMARGEDGFCVALDATTHRCTIYATRPQICRKFAMAGPYCREIRAEAALAHRDPIPHVLT